MVRHKCQGRRAPPPPRVPPPGLLLVTVDAPELRIARLSGVATLPAAACLVGIATLRAEGAGAAALVGDATERLRDAVATADCRLGSSTTRDHLTRCSNARSSPGRDRGSRRRGSGRPRPRSSRRGAPCRTCRAAASGPPWRSAPACGWPRSRPACPARPPDYPPAPRARGAETLRTEGFREGIKLLRVHDSLLGDAGPPRRRSRPDTRRMDHGLRTAQPTAASAHINRHARRDKHSLSAQLPPGAVTSLSTRHPSPAVRVACGCPPLLHSTAPHPGEPVERHGAANRLRRVHALPTVHAPAGAGAHADGRRGVLTDLLLGAEAVFALG